MDISTKRNILSGIVSKLQIKFILSLLLTVSINNTLHAAVPVILGQTQDTLICEGDSIHLEVITDQVYDYQWYYADYVENVGFIYHELPGEESNVLILDPVPRLSTFGSKYSLQIASDSDTIMSNVIYIEMPHPMPILDTVFSCVLPASIVVDPTSTLPIYDYVWSTGSTMAYPEVEDYGTYWVQISRDYGSISCAKIDTFQVLPCSPIMEIQGTFSERQYFCADTVYVTGDTELLRGMVLYPGTTVKYRGDFSLEASETKIASTSEDSIYIIGPDFSKSSVKGGSLKTYGSFNDILIENKRQNLVVKSLHSVEISQVAGARFTDNDSLRTAYTYSSKITNNKKVYLIHYIDSSFLAHNDSIFSIPTSSKFLPIKFTSRSCTYESNLSGVQYFRHTKGLGCYDEESTFTKNRFIRNQGSAIVSNSNRLMINQNLFIENTSDSGPPVLYLQNNCDLYMQNNTLIDNQGSGSNGILSDTNAVNTTLIANNVFWNSEGTEVPDIVLDDNQGGTMSLLDNSFSGAETSLSIPDGITLDTVFNYYSVYPEFIDTLNHDYHLAVTSPLIDAGMDIDEETDFDGNPREFGSGIDVGAYEYHPAGYPEFTYVTPDTAGCVADSITIKALADDNYIYTWFRNGELLEGLTTDFLSLNSLTGNDTGYYHASITNRRDTVLSDSIQVGVHPLPKPELGNDTTLLNDETIILEPGSFTNYLWSDNSNEPCLETSGGFSIWVSVTDENGCSASDSIIIALNTFVPDIPGGTTRLLIYPNPAQDILHIEASEIQFPCTLKIYSSEGRLIELKEIYTTKELHIELDDSLHPGIYLLHLETEQWSGAARFIKK